MQKTLAVLGFAVVSGLAAQASASTITYVTPAGATTSGPVDASATFITGNGALSIVLTNLEANPNDVAQLLSDLSFTLSGGLTTGSLQGSSGQEITVNGSGAPTLGATVPTGWLLHLVNGGFLLDDLNGGAGPEHTIIGPADGGGLYSDGNGSIVGNGPHNPFLNQTAMFLLTIPGMTTDTTVTSTTFSFGTVSGIDVPGEHQNVPEPASLGLFGLGLIGAGRRFWISRTR
jgi:hypothetical protein